MRSLRANFCHRDVAVVTCQLHLLYQLCALPASRMAGLALIASLAMSEYLDPIFVAGNAPPDMPHTFRLQEQGRSTDALFAFQEGAQQTRKVSLVMQSVCSAGPCCL